MAVAYPLGLLAGLHFLQKRLDDSERLYKRAIVILDRGLKEKKVDPNDSEFARSLNGLGTVYIAQRRYAEAEPLLLCAIPMRESAVFWDGPAPLGLSLSNLAEVYRVQRRFAKAESLYKRSLLMLETVLPQDHADLAKLLDDFAALYRAQGRHRDAVGVYTAHRERVRQQRQSKQ